MDTWNDILRSVEVRHGIVTRQDLLVAGLGPSRIRHEVDSGRLGRVHHGVYRVGGAPDTLDSRLFAALRYVGADDETWIGSFSASDFWDLGVARPDPRVHVVRANEVSARRSGVVVIRSTSILPHHVTRRRSIDVTTPSRTLFDLARAIGPLRLAAAVKVAVRRDDVPCSLASLYRVLYDLGGRGRPGTRRMRQVLDAWDLAEPFTESELDEVGRALLRDIPGIEWQIELGDEQGYIRRVDGLVRPAGVVIEFDSRFHDDPAQRSLDDDGDRRLRALGFVTKRYRQPDLTRRGDLTRDELLHLCRRAAA